MKQLYSLFVLLLLSLTLLQGSVHKGYIVTKNGKHLTGYIGSITYMGASTEVVFINDFGTPYNLRPELIRGFVFRREEKVVIYESLPTDRGWMFLEIIAKGDDMSLYRSPSEKTTLYIANSGFRTQTFKTTEYWIQRKDRRPFRLKKWRYRKRLRKLFREKAPELAEKIGDKGYRFKDLAKIIEEYNVILAREKYKL